MSMYLHNIELHSILCMHLGDDEEFAVSAFNGLWICLKCYNGYRSYVKKGKELHDNTAGVDLGYIKTLKTGASATSVIRKRNHLGEPVSHTKSSPPVSVRNLDLLFC